MIALTPSRIGIDHPAYAQSAQTKRLREIADHRGVWEPRRRPRLRPVIDGMINLIRDKHNLPFRAEIMQALHLCIAQNRASGVVRRIDEQQSRVAIGEPANLMEIDIELTLRSQRVVANRNPQRLCQGRIGWEGRHLKSYI